jgi:hypothetical protein
MAEKLFVEDRAGQQMLVTPKDALRADEDCCCPECEVCSDHFNRANNADINAGAPVTWQGDTSAFKIESNRCVTAASSVADVTITACSADRVRVFIANGDDGDSAHVSLISPGGTWLKGIVEFSTTGQGKIRLTGGDSGMITVNVPQQNFVSTTLVLCVTQYKDKLGIKLYSASGNIRIYDVKTGETFDPGGGTFGAAGFGVVETSHELRFDYFLAEQSEGTGDYADCPPCRTLPCLLCIDVFDSFPGGEMNCGWVVQTGSWENGFTSDANATLRLDDAFPAQGADPISTLVSVDVEATAGGSGQQVRVYLSNALASGPYLELTDVDGSEPGCFKIIGLSGEVIFQAASSGFGGGLFSFSYYLSDELLIVNFPAEENVFGQIALNPAKWGFGASRGMGVGTGAFSGGGLFVHQVEIYRGASEVWPYCQTFALACGIFTLPGFGEADLDSCMLAQVAGAWEWHSTLGGTGYKTYDENAWLRVNVPHPQRAEGKSVAYCYILFANDADSAGSQAIVGLGADAPATYVRVTMLAPVPDPLPRFCDQDDLVGLSSWIKLELFVAGELVATSSHLETVKDLGQVELKMCVGEGLVRVTLRTGCGWVTIFRELAENVDGEFWGVGTGAMNAAEGAFVDFHLFEVKLTSDHAGMNPFSDPPSPVDCEPCRKPFNPCANGPEMVKVVIAGTTGEQACCELLDGIYFLPPSFEHPGFYSIIMPPLVEDGGGRSYLRPFWPLPAHVFSKPALLARRRRSVPAVHRSGAELGRRHRLRFPTDGSHGDLLT